MKMEVWKEQSRMEREREREAERDRKKKKKDEVEAGCLLTFFRMIVPSARKFLFCLYMIYKSQSDSNIRAFPFPSLRY